MINLICVLTLWYHGVKVSKEMPGTLIEQRGDNYLVDFGFKVTLVNSNACLRRPHVSRR